MLSQRQVRSGIMSLEGNAHILSRLSTKCFHILSTIFYFCQMVLVNYSCYVLVLLRVLLYCSATAPGR